MVTCVGNITGTHETAKFMSKMCRILNLSASCQRAVTLEVKLDKTSLAQYSARVHKILPNNKQDFNKTESVTQMTKTITSFIFASQNVRT